MRILLVALLCGALAGCCKPANPRDEASDRASNSYHRPTLPYVDENDAEHQVVKTPSLDKVCRIAGSCAAVFVSCAKVDGKLYWFIEVPGARGEDDPLTNLMASGTTLEEATQGFLVDYRAAQAKLAYKRSHPAPRETVVAPCASEDCGMGIP